MPRSETLQLHFHIEASQQGQYLTLPFSMPENVERFELTYHYPKSKTNVVDLGLVGPDGAQVGASGSDKTFFFVSEVDATPGYTPSPLKPGEWQILAGAYKVVPSGIDIQYDLRFIFKEPRWLIGDTHAHTHASDGLLSHQVLAEQAKGLGMDYLIITDHNQFLRPEDSPKVPGLTVIPGVEWTHYQGHANFLGLHKPYDQPFFTNDLEGVKQRFESAHERGALISINHPADESLPFKFDFHQLPFDLIEIWNGPMRPSNLMAIDLWQKLLESGRKVPAIAGSDYHRNDLGNALGVPSTIVYAQSNSASDILAALRAGRSYMVYQAKSPRLEMHYGEAGLGDSTPWQKDMPVSVKLQDAKIGDLIKLIGTHGVYEFPIVSTEGEFEGFFAPPEPGFLRLELWRSLFGVLPAMPVLISNPIWMD